MTTVCALFAFLLFAATTPLVANASEPQARPEALIEQQKSAQELLEEYVRIALTESPSLAALRAREASAREQVVPASALPDPMVGVMYQSVGAPWRPMAPMSMVQGEISQPLPGFGKRQARRDVAQAESDVRKAETAMLDARIAAEVRGLFSQIYALDREQRAIDNSGQLIAVMLGAVTGRFISGGMDQEAIAKTEIERARLNEQALDIRVNREILSARLNRLLVRSSDHIIPRLDTLPEVPLDLGPISDAQLTQSPELRLQRANVTSAVQRRKSAETETHPDFLVGLSGGATTGGDPVFTLRFAMQLPLWSSTKQEPLIRAARIDTEAAEAEYRAAELKLRSELVELKARFRRDTQQVALYRDTIIPNAALALRAAQSAYSTGRADFATVIEDYRALLDAQIGLAKREAERLNTWAEIRAILAKPR